MYLFPVEIRLSLVSMTELVAGGYIVVEHKRTDLNLADLFTKPVPRQVFDALSRKLKGFMGWD